jgi:hypothetical protein
MHRNLRPSIIPTLALAFMLASTTSCAQLGLGAGSSASPEDSAPGAATASPATDVPTSASVETEDLSALQAVVDASHAKFVRVKERANADYIPILATITSPKKVLGRGTRHAAECSEQ